MKKEFFYGFFKMSNILYNLGLKLSWFKKVSLRCRKTDVEKIISFEFTLVSSEIN